MIQESYWANGSRHEYSIAKWPSYKLWQHYSRFSQLGTPITVALPSMLFVQQSLSAKQKNSTRSYRIISQCHP
jgi:hypothetical protein